jgi:hypothetical protein
MLPDVWFGRCNAQPDNLDNNHAHLHTHEKTDFLLEVFDAGTVWDEYGLQSNVVVHAFFFLSYKTS